ncbi:MAG: discoidin domain-containing protein [Candidatus Nitrosopolaris sp.]
MKHNELNNIFTGFLLSLMCAYIFASVSLFQPKFNNNAYAQVSFSIPKAQLIIQNKKVSMSPFVYIDDGKFKKVGFPALAGSNTEFNVEEGTHISFDFSRKPLKVEAFIVDYDGDIPSLLPLKKVGSKSFEIASLPGIWNIEIHATFPGGQYLSYTALANVLGNAESLSINSIGHETACSNQSNLKVQSVSDSNNKVNSLAVAQTLNGNNSVNPNTGVWSSTGKGSWIQFDLGNEKSICKLLVGFANGDKEINSFSIQTSTDGIHFANQGTVQNTGMMSGGELFNIPNSPILARYVKILFQSSGQGEISNLKVIGGDGIVNVGNAGGASSTSGGTGIEGGKVGIGRGNGTNAARS